jgi:opacity protein-like surface antigen
MIRLLGASLALTLTSSAPSLAQLEAGWFGGVTVGQSMWDGYDEPGPVLELDDSDIAWSAFGGYRFSYFAFSAGYTDLGALTARGGFEYEPPSDGATDPGTDEVVGGYDDKLEASGPFIAAHGVLPLSKRVQLIGTVGAFFWNHKVTYSDDSGPYNAEPSGTGLIYGVGVNFFVAPSISLAAEWRRYPEVGKYEETGHEDDIDAVTVGVLYHFGTR